MLGSNSVMSGGNNNAPIGKLPLYNIDLSNGNENIVNKFCIDTSNMEIRNEMMIGQGNVDKVAFSGVSELININIPVEKKVVEEYEGKEKTLIFDSPVVDELKNGD
jgi:hypothetical protein